MRVVISDMGVVAPGANSCREFEALLRLNSAVISPINDKSFLSDNLHFNGCVEGISDNGASRIRTLALAALRQLRLNKIGDLDRCGVVFASAINGSLEIDDAHKRDRNYTQNHILFGLITDEICSAIGLRGPRFTVSTGCAASLDALGLAYDQIVTGKADKMIVLTAEASLSPLVFASFNRIGALSHSDVRHSASQPFGRDRQGFVLAEGSASVVLERCEDICQRLPGNTVQMVGWHSLNNAYHMTSMRTDGSDLIYLIQQLLERINLSGEEIDLIDFHGTSTQINDLSEANMYKRIFSRFENPPACTAQKAYIGHSLGASNLIEVVGLALMLKNRFIAGLPSYDMLSDDIEIPFMKHTISSEIVTYALKISSSFSGIHTAVIFKAHNEDRINAGIS